MAGIKSSAAANTSAYAVVVAGGPVYGGGLTSSIKDFLNNLPPGNANPGHGPYILTRVGVFGNGQGETSHSNADMIKNSVAAFSDNGTLSNAVVVKIGQTEDLNTRAPEFVNQSVG